MQPRFLRRRLRRRVLLLLVGLVLFSGGIWLALRLATPSTTHRVRILPGASAPAPQYQVDQQQQSVRFRQEVAPGQSQEFEVKNTDQGLLVTPSAKK
ncbi:MAG TPA: hypothetical protein VGM19_14955 [Armatimonadota bacterium]|jgi:hypothetical protein